MLTEQNLGRQLQLDKMQVYALINPQKPVAASTPTLESNTVTEHANTSDVSSSQIRSLAEVERAAIEHAIAACDENVVKAASLLEVSPSTLYRKVQQWEN
jgi:two-component system repressor protein LuxO